jgi:hypothetical protein
MSLASRFAQAPWALKILAGEFREGDVIGAHRGSAGSVFSTAIQGEAVEA